MKSVLISHQGSGTNLLRALLNSHPEIHFGDELFVSRTDNTGPYQKKGNNIDKFLDKFFKSKKEKIVGFDLKYNQINDGIIQYIKENNFKILHLLRDPARTFFKNVNKNRKFSYDNVKKYCKDIRKRQNEIKNIFDDGKNYQEITYEELTKGREINSIDDYELNCNLQIFLNCNNCTFKLITDNNIVTKKLDIRF